MPSTSLCDKLSNILCEVHIMKLPILQFPALPRHSVAYRGGVWGVQPPPEIPKALQNRAKLNPIVKTVKKLLNLGRQHPKMFGKKAVKF